jgi:hypothetical protein
MDADHLPNAGMPSIGHPNIAKRCDTVGVLSSSSTTPNDYILHSAISPPCSLSINAPSRRCNQQLDPVHPQGALHSGGQFWTPIPRSWDHKCGPIHKQVLPTTFWGDHSYTGVAPLGRTENPGQTPRDVPGMLERDTPVTRNHGIGIWTWPIKAAGSVIPVNVILCAVGQCDRSRTTSRCRRGNGIASGSKCITHQNHGVDRAPIADDVIDCGTT